jgi:hypothetical protein
MANIAIERATEWKEREQISAVLTDHDNRIVALEGGGGGGGKARPQAVFDGSPDPILVGSQVRATVGAACTITGWTIIADVSGSAVVDILRATYAGYPTVTSITGSAKPTLTAATKATSTTLTGWSTSLAAGDVLVFNVDSASTVEQLYIVLDVT